MSFFEFPNTRTYDKDLGWLIKRVIEISETLKNFVALNTIKYADPIQWNITTQYEANTVVVDPITGTAYISSKPVPAGVSLTNTDYWSVIFTLDMISANKNITLRDDGSNVLATFGSVAGDWLIWNGTLYRVSQTINVNEAYVVGYNLTRYTVEMFINDYITAIKNDIGDLTNLNTTDQSNLVAAINEVITNIGNLTNLNTTDQSNLVAAINEVLGINKIFKDISEMALANNLNIGDVVITAYPYEAMWEVIAQQSPDLVNIDLANGLTAHLLNNVPINIGALTTLSNYDDISDIINFLITNNYKHIIVPGGIFKLNVTIPGYSSLSGMGRTATSFVPRSSSDTTIITVNGDEVVLKDFTIIDTINHNCDGITIGSNGCNNSHFTNLHIENCKRGLISFYSMIWDEFINCDFIGNFSEGFLIQGNLGAFFNNNLIESCKFNNNVNAGLHIDCQSDKCFGNTFNSSNMEYNAIDRFGVSTSIDYAVYITGANIFNGCYFEGNTQVATGACVKGVGIQLFTGCSFINEKYLVNNDLFTSMTCKFTYVGCKRYNDLGGIATPQNSYGDIILIGCNFSVPNTYNSGMLDIDKNKLKAYTSTTGVIDADYPVNRIRANVTSMIHAISGQILYICNDLNASYTIDGSLMASGQPLTIAARSGLVAMVNYTGSAHVLMPLYQ